MSIKKAITAGSVVLGLLSGGGVALANARHGNAAMKPAEAVTADTDNVQQGDQTMPDTTSAGGIRTSASDGNQGSGSESSSEGSGSDGAQESDGPGGHQDPPGDVNHEFNGQE